MRQLLEAADAETQREIVQQCGQRSMPHHVIMRLVDPNRTTSLMASRLLRELRRLSELHDCYPVAVELLQGLGSTSVIDRLLEFTGDPRPWEANDVVEVHPVTVLHPAESANWLLTPALNVTLNSGGSLAEDKEALLRHDTLWQQLEEGKLSDLSKEICLQFLCTLRDGREELSASSRLVLDQRLECFDCGEAGVGVGLVPPGTAAPAMAEPSGQGGARGGAQEALREAAATCAPADGGQEAAAAAARSEGAGEHGAGGASGSSSNVREEHQQDTAIGDQDAANGTGLRRLAVGAADVKEQARGAPVNGRQSWLCSRQHRSRAKAPQSLWLQP
jgi:hypothetical protein